MQHIAIADPGRPGKVSLWCGSLKRHQSGRISFEVNNGGWNGSIKDGLVRVNQTQAEYPGQIVWEGAAPFAWHQYNEAIRWIEDQIASGAQLARAFEQDQFEELGMEERPFCPLPPEE